MLPIDGGPALPEQQRGYCHVRGPGGPPWHIDRRDYFRAHAPPLGDMFWIPAHQECNGDLRKVIEIMAVWEQRWRNAYADAMLEVDENDG